MLTVVYWLCLPWLLLVAFGAFRSGRSSLSDLFGFALTLTPLSIWLLLTTSVDAEVEIFTCLGYLDLGLIATIMTGDLMRHYKMTSSYRRVQPVFLRSAC